MQKAEEQQKKVEIDMKRPFYNFKVEKELFATPEAKALRSLPLYRQYKASQMGFLAWWAILVVAIVIAANLF